MTRRVLIFLLLFQTVARAADVDSKPATLQVEVRLNARPAPGGTRLFVHRPGRVDDEVATGWPGEPFNVPAGRWEVRAVIPAGAMGTIEVSRFILTTADKPLRITLDAVRKFGFLLVSVKSGDVVIEDAAATLHAGKPRTGNGVPLVVGMAEPTPVGRYTVGVEWDSQGGTIQKWLPDVEVAFEETNTLVVDIGPTGMLSVDLQNAPDDSNAEIALVRAKRIEPVGTLAPFVPFRVPAGVYSIRVVQTWPRPALWWKRNVEIKPDEEKMVIIDTR